MKSKKLLIVIATMLSILIFAAVLNGCDKLGLKAPENIKYNGALLSWDAVENADKYVVQINGGEEKSISTNSMAFDALNAEFSVTVTAVTLGKKETKSDGTTMTFKPLDRISKLNVANDGTVSWAEIPLATNYIIKVNGKELSNYLTATAYSELGVGNSVVEVKPTVSDNSGYYSSWSPSVTVNKLAVPTTITYDGEMISWYAVTGATDYEVYANSVLLEDVTGTKVAYNSQNTNFSVTVKAIGNHSSSFDSAVSAAKDFIFLKTVSDITVDEGILKWEEITGADGYKIKINNVVQSNTLNTNSYPSLRTGEALSVNIMPIANDTSYFSSWSSAKAITILAAPEIEWDTTLALDGEANNNLTWDYSGQPGGFNVKVIFNGGDPAITPFGSDQRAFAHKYEDVGTYKVSVQALANTTNVFSSSYSKVITVVRLPAPTKPNNNFIVSDAKDIDEGFTINYNTVSGATTHRLYKEGGVDTGISSNNGVMEVESVIDSNIISEQRLNYYIRSIGSYKEIEGLPRVTLDSLTSTALTVSITVLAMPNNVTISGYNMTWDAVGTNSKYAVDYENGITEATTTSYILTNNLTESGEYDVKVCTKGDGGAILPSNYSSKITVIRLAAPTNIRLLNADSQEGILNWTTVNNASSYYAYINNSGTPITVNNESNLLGQITTEGTTIHMQAVANYFKENSTDIYYMTSPNSDTLTIKRLQKIADTSITFSNTEISWAAPSNVSEDFTPTYRLYDNNGNVYPGAQNGTKMNIADFEAGTYTFTIKAIGDGTSFINSEVSGARTIIKLATPTVTVVNNAYSWASVANTSSYSLYIDGKSANDTYHLSGTTYSYTPTFTTIGNHTVKVYAVGDNGSTTIDSKPFSFTQKVEKLATPENFTIGYSKEAYATDGQILVTLAGPIENALGYYYVIGGTDNLVAGNGSTSYGKVPDSASGNQISVTVRAQGGTISGTNPATSTYYIDSSEEAGRGITLLGKPNMSGISLSTDKVLSWGTVSSAVGYDIELTIGAGTPEIITVTGNTPTYNLSEKINSNDVVKIRIRAKGNSTNIVTSAWSDIFEKLVS